MGDLGWEVSGDSQIELDCVDGTEVRVSDRGRRCLGGGDGGFWNVDDVTVLLALDSSEVSAIGCSVVDWGLAWGQPGGWEAGDFVYNI